MRHTTTVTAPTEGNMSVRVVTNILLQSSFFIRRCHGYRNGVAGIVAPKCTVFVAYGAAALIDSRWFRGQLDFNSSTVT
jgi:hypothetical protein